MVQRPVVFISSTSDLRAARDLVGSVLYSMGYEPVWQEIAPTDGGELLGVLRKRIDACALLVQLVGQRYGAEPIAPTAEFGRASYSQFEALYAEKLGKKVIYQFLAPEFPTEGASADPPELTALQADYKQRIKAANRLRRSNIASSQELELSIRRLRDDLAELRRQSDRRFRHVLVMVGATMAAIAAVGGLTGIILHRQSQGAKQNTAQSNAVNEQLATMREELRAALAPRPLEPGRTTPEPLPPALVAKAKTLLERGNAEEQAVAKMALRQHIEADRIIQELKSRPGSAIDEALGLLTMEGDNWYNAGEPDKAIEPYEQAMALRPGDIAVRSSAALARTFARQGDCTGHRRRAIEILDGSLARVPSSSAQWAAAQDNLGIAWAAMPTGDRAENLARAIAAYEAALTVRTKDAFPVDWARTQNNLAAAWADVTTGERAQNLAKAIAAYEGALTVFTRTAYPTEWAMLQSNLGVARAKLPTGNRAENLQLAIAAYEAALTVRTKEAQADDWATTQNNLASAWMELPAGDHGQNLSKAIAAYEAVLTVHTRDAYPANWAATQHNLGNAWSSLPTGNRAENLAKAIAAYEAALAVRTKDADPAAWAATQNCLAAAWADLPAGDHARNLAKAIAAYEGAVTVYTRAAYPADWARAQSNLGSAWRDLPTGDRTQNLREAISAYDAALTVQTKASCPNDWAATQNNLGNAWSSLSTGDRAENLRKAMAAYDAALSIYTKASDPAAWATIQNNMGIAWSEMPAGDRSQNLAKAVAAYQAALTVRTRDSSPAEWAMVQNNLAGAWVEMSTGDGAQSLPKAIAAYEAALSVYTRDAYPANWATIQTNLGIVWRIMSTGDPAANLHSAIAAHEAALSVFVRSEHPRQWASEHSNIALAAAKLADLPAQNGLEWLALAIAHEKAALLVFTAAGSSSDNAAVQASLQQHRQAYEAQSRGATTRPFDGIAPAE